MTFFDFLKKSVDQVKSASREMEDCERLLDKNIGTRPLIFYSESSIYFQYFEGIIDYLLKNSDIPICYITSDPTDPVFRLHSNRFQPFFIRTMILKVFAQLNAKIVVTTTPDLNHQFGLKRSQDVETYIYKFHAMVSMHQQYNLGAFDHFDTMFCVGPHHIVEFRRSEALYNSKPKELVPAGYHRAEKIYREHQSYIGTDSTAAAEKTILVAPTWGGTSIFETCIDELIQSLGGTSNKVYLRPHPEFIKRKPQDIVRLKDQLKKTPNIVLETDLLNNRRLHEADVLITDRSGIAFEYAFGTERPVLFIDTPSKVFNSECAKLEIKPIEDLLRNQLGARMQPSQIARELRPAVDRAISGRDTFRESIREVRDSAVFNWLRSTEAEGHYIKELLAK